MTAPEPSEGPLVSAGLRTLLDEIMHACTGNALPNSVWYHTESDYRAKYVSGPQFRVFVRVKIAKQWFTLHLKDVADIKVLPGGLDPTVREKIRLAYKKAESYLGYAHRLAVSNQG